MSIENSGFPIAFFFPLFPATNPILPGTIKESVLVHFSLLSKCNKAIFLRKMTERVEDKNRDKQKCHFAMLTISLKISVWMFNLLQGRQPWAESLLLLVITFKESNTRFPRTA